MKQRIILAAGAGTALLLGSSLSPALAGTAAGEPSPRATMAKGLVTPLSAAVTRSGKVYVSQNFAGVLVEKRPGKKPTVVFAAKEGNEVGAVSVRNGVVTFAVSTTSGGAVVKRATKVDGKWRTKTVADVAAFEVSENPDGDVTYAFQDISEECAAQVDPEQTGPATYTGVVESHPYATASDGETTYLADAAGNTIVAVADDGTVSEVAVLPGAEVEVTAEMAEAFGFPECVAGLTYVFEPVPTDVEVDEQGMLLVSTLPGGPEDGSVGALGAVYEVNPNSGNAKLVAGGLISAVGVALADNGDIYVSELFRPNEQGAPGRISRIAAGTDQAVPFKTVALPGAVEISGGKLYATIEVLSEEPPFGRLVRFGL